MDFQGVRDLWLSAYVHEYITRPSEKALDKLRKFLHSETPSYELLVKVSRYDDFRLVRVFEQYLTQEILTDALQRKMNWPYVEPLWFYNLLVAEDGDILSFLRYALYHREFTVVLKGIPVTKENAEYIAELFSLETTTPALYLADIKDFILSYPEVFDLDLFIKNLDIFVADEEVLRFALSIDGIFEEELPQRVFLKLVGLTLEEPNDPVFLTNLFNKLYNKLHTILDDIPEVYYYLAQIEYQLPDTDPARFIAYLMKARDFADAESLRKRYFQELFLGKSITETLPEVALSDDVESLIYLLNLLK